MIDGQVKHRIHYLCNNEMLDDVSLEILRFLLDIDPTLPQIVDVIIMLLDTETNHLNSVKYSSMRIQNL